MAEKSKILAQRRAILLAIIGATPADSVALKAILNNGLLVTIKSWLDEILNIGIGGVDLLLHLLGSIAMLPVTKEMVTSSKLGKLVASVEKHPICVGGMNEAAIRDRVSKVKDEWSASVKRLKKVSNSYFFRLKNYAFSIRCEAHSHETLFYRQVHPTRLHHLSREASIPILCPMWRLKRLKQTNQQRNLYQVT